MSAFRALSYSGWGERSLCGVCCLEVYIYRGKNEAIYEYALRNSCSRLSNFERRTAKEHFPSEEALS